MDREQAPRREGKWASDEIWISNIFNDSTIVRGTDIDRSEPGWISLTERQSVSEADLPLNIYAHYKDETFRNLPPAFEGAGGPVRETALEGADMWMDPKLDGSLFMKGRLVAALQQAGFAKIFSLTRCRVV